MSFVSGRELGHLVVSGSVGFADPSDLICLYMLAISIVFDVLYGLVSLSGLACLVGMVIL